MKKFLLKICIYAIVVTCISNALAWGGMYILRNSDLYKPSYLVRNLSTSTRLDYVILGSSTGLTGLNTQVIDSLVQTNGFNLSLDGMGPSGQYMILSLFFNKGYQTDRLILSLDSLSANDANIRQLSMNEYYFLPWLCEDSIYRCFRSREEGLLKVLSSSRYCPVLGFSYYNQQLLGSCFLALKNPRYKWHFDDRGNESYGNTMQVSGEKEIPVRTDTLYLSNPYVRKIEALCRKNGVELIYYLPPQWKRNTFFADSAGHRILNHRDALNQLPECFNDEMHVNGKGRKMLSERVARELWPICKKAKINY